MPPRNKKKKVYLVLLAVSGVALGADRLFSSSPVTGPADAAASLAVLPAERSAAAVAGHGSVTSLVASSAPSKVSIAEQLRRAAALHHVDGAQDVDLFRPSPEWLAEALPAETNESRTAPGPALSTDFMTTHHLTGLIVSRHQSLAIINGQTLRPGQAIDGFQLVEVGQRSAVFVGPNGARVTLPMEDSTPLPPESAVR